MTLLPLVACRSQAKYSQISPVASVLVSSQMVARSVELFGFVNSSIGTVAVWITLSFVSDELTGPSSATLPDGSWISTQQSASGTKPSMLYGTCAKAAAGISNRIETRLVAIAAVSRFSE